MLCIGGVSRRPAAGGPVGWLSRPVAGALSPRGRRAFGKKAAWNERGVGHRRSNMKLARFVPVLVLSGLILMACGGSSGGTTAAKPIALLLPETATARYD